MTQDVRNSRTRSPSQSLSDSKLSNTKTSPNTPQNTATNNFYSGNTKNYNPSTPKQTPPLEVQSPVEVVFVTALEDKNKSDRVNDSQKRKPSESSKIFLRFL